MCEKRFTKCDTTIRDNGEEMNQTEVRDMLNKQNEQIDFLADILSELSAYMIALGFDIELEYKDGRTINLSEVVEE